MKPLRRLEAIDKSQNTTFSRHETIPSRGYKDVYYGLPVVAGMTHVTIEAKLRYRQADQRVAEILLAAVPGDLSLETVYGLKSVPTLPIVDMVVKTASLPTRR